MNKLISNAEKSDPHPIIVILYDQTASQDKIDMIKNIFKGGTGHLFYKLIQMDNLEDKIKGKDRGRTPAVGVQSHK